MNVLLHWFVYMSDGKMWVRTHGPFASQETALRIGRGYSSCNRMVLQEPLEV